MFLSNKHIFSNVLNIVRVLLPTVSLLDALLMVTSPTSSEFSRHQTKIYKGGGLKLRQVLDTIMSDEEGSGILVDWMRPYTLWQVCDTMKDEMEALGKDFLYEHPRNHTHLHQRVDHGEECWNPC